MNDDVHWMTCPKCGISVKPSWLRNHVLLHDKEVRLAKLRANKD